MRTHSFIILAVLNALLFTTAAVGSDTAPSLGTAAFVDNATQARQPQDRPVIMTADLNRDNLVDGSDVAIVLAGWGNCTYHLTADLSASADPTTQACQGDINHDGRVDIDDLVFVLSHWS